MKKYIKIWVPVLFVVILCIFLSSCNGDASLHEGPAAQDESGVVENNFEPLTFYSFDSLTASITEKKASAEEDIHNLKELDHLYVPTMPLQEMVLDAITVRDRYVCIYYCLEALDSSEVEAPDDEEIARISNTVKLEWVRNEDGEELLTNTIEQLSLTEYYDGIYYYNITYPTQPDTILAQSFFWVHDGFMFNLDIPFDVCASLLTQGSIDSFIGVEKIELT